MRQLLLPISLCAVAIFCARETWAQDQLKTVGVFTIAPIEAQATSIWLDPFHKALRDRGWVEGKNVAFAYGDAGGDPTRIDGPLAELTRRKLAVLMAVGPPVVRSAFATIKDVPIIAHDLVQCFIQSSLPATAERCADLVARVLAGADPGQLPIERPTKFEFVVNLSAAKQLRLNVPDALLVRADRVIK